MNKKRICALTALTLTAALALSACGKTEEPVQTATTSVVKETEKASVVTVAPRELDVKEAKLTVTTWSSPNGATINMTAVPESHEDGDTAEFVIRLDGVEVTREPCQWEKDAYVASVDLNAEDGYGYYIAISGEQGAFAETPINDETVTRDARLMNLATSLNTYCALTLNDTVLEDDALTILEGYAMVKTPVIVPEGEAVTCAKAELVLLLDGEVICTEELNLVPGETEESYDASITDMSFELPQKMEEGQQMFLRLDVQMTNGQTVTAEGGSWQYVDGSIAGSVG